MPKETWGGGGGMVRYGHAFIDGLINHKKVDKHRTKSEQSQEKIKEINVSMSRCS